MADSRSPWSVAELAYLAGIIDGEGSIGTRLRRHSKSGRAYYDWQIHVASTDEPLIVWLWERFGGRRDVSLSAKQRAPHHKPLYRWHLCQQAR